MEYLCLSLQILFILGTIFLTAGETYLIHCNKLYKKHLIIVVIVQILCIIFSIINLFIQPKIIICFLALQMILSGLIKLFFSLKAKMVVLDELKNRIIEKNIMNLSSNDIRKILIEEYEQVYFIEDIEKCLSKINK